jgi:hypothetical protein
MTATFGPWRVGNAGRTVFGPPNGNPSPQTIADGRSRADVALIVAAVNACKRINPTDPITVAESLPTFVELIKMYRSATSRTGICAVLVDAPALNRADELADRLLDSLGVAI